MRRTESRYPGGANCRRAIALAWALLAAPGLPAWASVDQVAVGEFLRQSVEQLGSRGELAVAGQTLRSRTGLPAVYESRGFRPLWSDRSSEEALLGEIAAASGDGLNPADYHFDALREQLERRSRRPDDAAVVAQADLLMTDALLRLAVHFHLGKVDPAAGEARWDSPVMLRGEPAAGLLARIATGGALSLQLGELRPVQPMYGRLKSALARYRLIAAEGGWQPVPPGRVLQLGMEDPRVPLLRQRLAATGDFPGLVLDSPRFEPALAEAVRRFQARHQLEVDGLFGPATLRALNRPIGELEDQLLVNLERARWMLTEVRGRFLVVDPAGARVVLMDNSRPVLAQPAHFTAALRTTPAFRTEMRYLVVHPELVLPATLVESQVAPLARRDPPQLEARGLQVLGPGGEVIPAARIDWARPGDVLVRQLPGPQSFLGPVRFPLGGRPGVFLHGAPARGDDALPGAVRLDDATGLARALAGPPSAWTAEEFSAVIRAGAPRTFPLARPLPVLYAPWTVWVELDGTVSFRGGFEERDAAILASLRRRAGPG